jgi:hypothetical protein
LHGACIHTEEPCTLIPKLRNEPNFKVNSRKRKQPSTSTSPSQPRTPRGEKATNKVLLQRLDALEKETKLLRKEKRKKVEKKTKPEPVDSDSGEELND